MTTPLSTYRLQLNSEWTFADAKALVPYLTELGVSHVYLSPILKAQEGSTHGYDTVDHRQINPELGTIEDFRALAQACREAGLGIVLDFVPNHMGVGGSGNDLWLDVLKHGKESRYADWFDINWEPSRPDLVGKVMVPFLGTSYAEALHDGQIQLKADGDGFAVWAYDKEKLPLRPEDEAALLSRYGSADAAVAALNGTAGEPGSWLALDTLVGQQHWLLIHFASAADEINYRRFFINNDLAGIRIDRPDVFDHAHQLIFQLIEEGWVDGLRIDHVDGLLDPKGYLEALRAKSPRPIYLLIEKILAPHEQLRADWPVDGTTGYEFGAQLTRVLNRANGETSLSETYRDFVGEMPDPHEEAYRCKSRVMDNELAVELAGLARILATLAWSVPRTRDLTEIGLRKAMREVIAQLGVYRAYAGHQGFSKQDRREYGLAVGRARQREPFFQPALFDFIGTWLNGELGPEYDPALVARATGRLQQYTGPVMAKGLEDTALYRANRLVSLNEVGAHPDRWSIGIAAFHDSNRQRLATHPHAMLATSTHDTKRGEDTRAMIGAIADHPDEWRGMVASWREQLEGAGASDIHPNDLYLLFQLLVGGWPIEAPDPSFADRLKGAMEKSLREARERSDWAVVNADYEATVKRFVDRMIDDTSFMDQFILDRAPLLATGRRKGLIQAALKLTVPGVPDTYRGAEDWEQSFVDPDNRRPVDFAALEHRLGAPKAGRDDKLILTKNLLRLRRRQPDLFRAGTYEALDLGEEILAFRRAHGGAEMIVAADLSAGHTRDMGALLDQFKHLENHGIGPVAVFSSKL